MKLFILLYLIIINIITINVYKHDKIAAEKKEWRISEKNLHLLSVLGGWPGAIFAQEKFRHKTIKQPFRNIFWLTVLINIIIVIYLFF